MAEGEERGPRGGSTRAVSAGMRRRTRRVVRPSGPPTSEIPVWTSPDGVDVDTGRAVVDLALRAGVALVATGASGADVVEAVLSLTRAYGLRSVHVDVTFGAITVSYHRGPHAEPMTVMRVVRSRSQDFARLERLYELVRTLVAHPLPVDEARVRIDAVIRAPHPYRRWVVSGANGLLAGAAAWLLGGAAVIVVIAALAVLAVDRVVARMSKAGFAAFFCQASAAGMITAVAAAVSFLQLRLASSGDAGLLAGVFPSLLVASGIVVLFSGLSVVGAAQDAIEGFYVTAAARAFEVIVLTLGIVVGILVVLSIANGLGVAMSVDPEASSLRAPVASTMASVVIAAAAAIGAYGVGRGIVLSACAGGISWAVYLAVSSMNTGRPLASAAAAFVIGFPAQLASSRVRVPALLLTTAAVVPLVPGRLVYQGIFELVTLPQGTGLSQGMGTLTSAAGVGMGLAAGVSLGTYLARLLLRSRQGRRTRAPGAQTR